MKRDIQLGLMRIHILHHACEEAIYGTGMMEELRRHGYEIGPGTFYPMIHRMEERGYLKSTKEKVAGRIRRTYRATPAGRGLLVELRDRVRELFREVLADHYVEHPVALEGGGLGEEH